MTQPLRQAAALLSTLAVILGACGNSPTGEPGAGGNSGTTGGAGGAAAGVAGSAGGGAGGSAGSSVAGSGRSGGSGGSGGSGSSAAGSGGGAGVGMGGDSGAAGAGASAGSGGNAAGSGGAGQAGSGAGGGPAGGCAAGAWPASDPSTAGPYTVVTEMDVGPRVGAGEEEGELVAFTLFRPEELGRDGRCHPVITWGNGSGSNPSLYGVMLRHLASHGFVVIASNSPSVATGDPPPMLAGVTWVLEQNADPASPLYQHIDASRVGATGHSLGGFATSQVAGDPLIKTIAPLCGAASPRNANGPALLVCGGEDEVVECSGIESAFESIDDQPAMFANYLTADHADWVTFRGSDLSPVEVAVTAWMRVQLMGDTALRPWFYGADCGLCSDPAWQVRQSMMDL